MTDRSFPPALEAAGIIGTWQTDVEAGRSILDDGAAALMAGDAGLAGKPLPLDVALGRIHPDDRDWVFAHIRRARRSGGPFTAEFRVRGPGGSVRWVLNQGRLPAEGAGGIGYGMYIDTTHRHRDPAAGSEEPRDWLEVAADHCIAAREAIDRSGKPFLRLLIDALLLEIGRHLVRRRSH
ncbi:PAS domain-containing protein [Methylobacterium radiodurans]|uniref:Diguanylate cyclase n=1 Tax=Methylobacterium radiodurans TaxID=2202828 RepID=A0A2U8VPA5_9HYPH|nr:PAS domain-containing protein [Methylobacterium radiodurans]AWN35222.1 diguanylate cyclase [Methylobacterium radiodurans]